MEHTKRIVEKDIRFTTKGDTLYAIALGWLDDGKMIIKSLTHTADGLVVELPGEKSSNLTYSLCITGSNLKQATLLHNNFNQ